MPALTSPRLLLRPLSDPDEALYCRLYGDRRTMAWVGAPQPPDVARRGFLAAVAMNRSPSGRRRFWVMQEKRSGADLGLLGLTLDAPGGGEVGVLLPDQHQGRGYATEAIAALADHAFHTLGLACLHTRHMPGHALAAGLMASLGFERVLTDDAAPVLRWRLGATRWAGLSRRQDSADPLT